MTGGIGGGIISGLIVYIITYFLFSKKQNKEHRQKVKTANNELLYTMRPLVVKKQIPTKVIMDSIIESTARKHEVNKNELFDISLISDELIREVMENTFLESEQKIEFCHKIYELKKEYKKVEQSDKLFNSLGYQTNPFSFEFVSLLLGTIVFLMVSVFSIFESETFEKIDLPEFKLFTPIAAVLVSMTALIMTYFLKRLKKQSYRNKIIRDILGGDEID